MIIDNRIAASHDELTRIRRDIHAHPETAFEEERTAGIVAKLLESYRIEVHRGLAKTGVVGTLKVGNGTKSIALRAELDALNIYELNEFDHKSVHEGKMHACGHDGHTTMLLGAARYLAETKHFDGTVYFVFQPAEENLAGGRVMVEDGLFDKFPCEAVYGMHNAPGLPVGKFAVTSGPVLASADFFEVKITGVGAHAGYPQWKRPGGCRGGDYQCFPDSCGSPDGSPGFHCRQYYPGSCGAHYQCDRRRGCPVRHHSCTETQNSGHD